MICIFRYTPEDEQARITVPSRSCSGPSVTRRAAQELVFAPRGAFSLARTSARFARLPDPVNVVGDGSFARLVPAGDELALVRVSQEGPAPRARLPVRIPGARGAA